MNYSLLSQILLLILSLFSFTYLSTSVTLKHLPSCPTFPVKIFDLYGSLNQKKIQIQKSKQKENNNEDLNRIEYFEQKYGSYYLLTKDGIIKVTRIAPYSKGKRMKNGVWKYQLIGQKLGRNYPSKNSNKIRKIYQNSAQLTQIPSKVSLLKILSIWPGNNEQTTPTINLLLQNNDTLSVEFPENKKIGDLITSQNQDKTKKTGENYAVVEEVCGIRQIVGIV